MSLASLALLAAATLPAFPQSIFEDRFCTVQTLHSDAPCEAACVQPDRLRATEVDGVRHLLWTLQGDSLSIGVARSEDGRSWQFDSIAFPDKPRAVDVRGTLAAVGHGQSVTILRLVSGSWITEQVIPIEQRFTVTRAVSVGEHDGVERVVAGTGFFDIGVAISGKAVVLRNAGGAAAPEWTLEATFVAPGGTQNNAFGSAVAIDGARLAIAHPHGSFFGSQFIEVHALVEGEWTLESTIPKPRALNTPFGLTLALKNDLLAARSGLSDCAVQLFRSVGGIWQPLAYLQGEGSNQAFGHDLSIAVEGEVGRLAIGVLPSSFDDADGPVLTAGWMCRIQEGIVLSITPLRAPLTESLDANARSVSIVNAEPLWVAMACPDPAGTPTIRIAERDPDDCDADGVPDACAIIDDPSLDENLDGVPDSCESIPGDLDGNGIIDGADLGLLLGAWGQSGGAADLNGDGTVDGADLGSLLASWTG